MYVIGFGGIAGSGKSTAADYVEIESLNHDCKPIRLSFADPVRAQAAKQAGYDDWRIFKHEKPDLYRELCQLVADEGRPSTWVNLLNEKLKQIQAEELSDSNLLFEERLVIIDDLRYSKEIELVKAWQGLTVYVSPGNRIVADADGAWRAHESEWLNQRIEGGVIEIENYYEWVVFNSGDPMAFEKKLHDRLQFFIGCSPSRFADECNCPACLGFRVDIQADEMINGFEEAIKDIRQSNMPQEVVDEIVALYRDYVDGLKTGRYTPMDILSKNVDTHEEDDL